MEPRHLRLFVAVAETGSLRRAAVRLHVAHPALGRQLHQLEADVDCPLLERSTRAPLRLTPAGRVFLDEARAILARAAQGLAAVRRAAGNPAAVEKLTVGFLGSGHLPRLRRAFARFRQVHPAVDMDFFKGTAGEQLAALRAGRIQAACLDSLSLESGGFDLTGIASRTLYRVALVAVLPRAHPFARERTVSLAALAGEPFVFCPRAQRPGLHDYVMAQCRAASGTAPRVTREIGGELPAIVGLVATAGERLPGPVSLLPATVRCVRLAGAVYRPLRAPVPRLEVRLAWLAGEVATSPLLASLVESGPWPTARARGKG